MDNVKTISLENFKALSATSTPFVIDVRTRMEFEGVHLEGVVLFPLQELNAESIIEAQVMAGRVGEPVYILCKAGKRAMIAAHQLSKSFQGDLVVVEGGTDACVAADMPIRVGKGGISLERQVFMASGILVLLGVMLGAMVAPGFYYIAVFIGFVHLLAGLADVCLIRIVLSKMAWNIPKV